jgi:hypothetical protein
MSERIQDILQELAGLYDQQRRFVTPRPSDEPVVFSVRELAEYRKTSDRIARLNDELTQGVTSQQKD